MTDHTQLAREILDEIRQSLGMEPDPWPSDRELNSGESLVLLELTQFLEQKLVAASSRRVEEVENELTQAEWDALEMAIYGKVGNTREIWEWARLEITVLEIIHARVEAALTVACREEKDHA